MSQMQPLPDLTRRQEEILSLIVRSYTETPEPVSSKTIVETYNLEVSSATVRNEMARLEELGFIAAPHTSAGRIPTALGYRYIVRDMLTSSALSAAETQYIENKFNELPPAIDQWLRQAATVLARTSQTASLVTPPTSDKFIFKHLQLIAIQGRLALMILVLEGGAVHQRMLTLAEPVTQMALSHAADHINSLCDGLSATQIRLKLRQFGELEREVCEIATDIMDRSANNQVRMVYRHGLSEIINAFPDTIGAEQAVRVFEERAFLDMILTDLLHPLLDAGEQDVQVIIAGDGYEEMSQLSLVLTRYGIPGKIRGTIGVVGPMNLNYGRAISAVRKVSGVMSDMLVELYDTHPLSDRNDANTDTRLD